MSHQINELEKQLEQYCTCIKGPIDDGLHQKIWKAAKQHLKTWKLDFGKDIVKLVQIENAGLMGMKYK